jgi:putative chitinase
MLITEEQLKNIATRMPDPLVTEITGLINLICPDFGMNRDVLQEFLPNVLHESDEFTRLEENLNYSAKRLTEVWPSRFPNIAAAQPYANNPRGLANKVYGGRMGNEQRNDGWDFRGGGAIQLTGRGMYSAFARFMLDRFGMKRTAQEWAELIRTNQKWSMYAACWFFSVAKDLNGLAVNDEMKVIVKRINGGFNGLDDRMKYYVLCKKHLPE